MAPFDDPIGPARREPAARRSAVVATILLPRALASLHDLHDPMAALGVPPHVTVLFPFLSADALSSSVRGDLLRIAAAATPFLARFANMEERDRMIWLLPSDPAPFLQLTAAVAARWPEHPPYGGAHDTLIPHLTLLETRDERTLELSAAAVVEEGPFQVVVDALELIVEGASGRWRERWRLPLGPA